MRHTIGFLLLGALLTIGVGPVPAAPQVIYGSQVDNNSGDPTAFQSTLVTISPTTGLITSTLGIISTTPGNSSGNVLSVGAMAFDSSQTLWAIGKPTGSSGLALFTISYTGPTAGTATQVATIGNVTGNNVTDMTFGPGGVLYAVVGNGSTSFTLYTIPTAPPPGMTAVVATSQGLVTNTNGGNALSYTAAGAKPGLYLASGNKTATGGQTGLFTPALTGNTGTPPQVATFNYSSDPNLAAWLATQSGIQSPGLRTPAMQFTADGSTIYAELLNGMPMTADNVASALVTIDPSTGLVTFLGQTLGPGTNTIDAIAFQVPEPGSLALLTATAVSALGYAWRRRRAVSQPPLSA